MPHTNRVAHHGFFSILLVTQINPNSGRRKPDKDMNIRSPRSLGAIVEVGHHKESLFTRVTPVPGTESVFESVNECAPHWAMHRDSGPVFQQLAFSERRNREAFIILSCSRSWSKSSNQGRVPKAGDVERRGQSFKGELTWPR
jgi:hypothetical protein